MTTEIIRTAVFWVLSAFGHNSQTERNGYAPCAMSRELSSAKENLSNLTKGNYPCTSKRDVLVPPFLSSKFLTVQYWPAITSSWDQCFISALFNLHAYITLHMKNSWRDCLCLSVVNKDLVEYYSGKR